MKYKVLGVTGAAIVGSIMLADSAEASQSQGTVTAEVLNVRTGSNTSHPIIGKVYKGQAVTIAGEENGWYKVNHQGKVGYVSGAYVKAQASSKPQTTPPTQNVGAGPTATNGTYKVTANVLNVRAGSGTSHRVIGKTHGGQVLAVTGEENGWYKVNYNGQTGYVSAEYMQKVGGNVPSIPAEKPKPEQPKPEQPKPEQQKPTVPPTASGNVSGAYTVTAGALNVRQEPNASSQKIGTVYMKQQVTVVAEVNGWYKIEYSGQTGYVSKSYVTKSTETTQEVTPPPPPASPAIDVEAMLTYAKTLIGTPYVFGGSPPSTGLDCSGFVYNVLDTAGKKIGRTNVEGYWNSSKYFTKIDSPKVGDLIFFQNTYRIGPSHIGIMVDNAGNFIHANDGSGVAISSMHSNYYKQKFLGFKRIH